MASEMSGPLWTTIVGANHCGWMPNDCGQLVNHCAQPLWVAGSMVLNSCTACVLRQMLPLTAPHFPANAKTNPKQALHATHS